MKKFLIAAVALSVLGSAGAAAAQPYGGARADDRYERRDDRRDNRQDNRSDRRDDRSDRREDRRDDRYDRRDDRRDHRADRRSNRQETRWERRAERRYNAGRYQAPRGYYAQNWRRGQYLPQTYRARGYYVDYRAYRLPPPPRGYAYYRNGDDVILTAIATGLIASVLFDLFD